ncbi:biofilm regulation diguanylate cyclase SiaD [Billgrantia kenyensis]|uniref:diguanylate cyclase n=1 Tax=Billgrantia kenyensis TaxID=321266 RepID=A0A7W0AF21_9GAMM|nr:biofilm regulation diguanylate cyclase SiaD [Halomonas kenyensis]MBA2780160.1 GGDEF domain-containing protein [Halomonas kenyensis]MCG6663053.1 GGDEF domain-containing protein [Halomonas kenyensis]
MKDDHDEALLAEIATLLDSSEHAGHPLHDALQRLYRHHCEQRGQMHRLIDISDRYQLLAMEARQVTQQRYERTLRRQRKLSRISDGYQALMHERNKALRQASTHDPLTELPNRRLICERLETLVAEHRAFTLALLDIDHFKRINDHHGHDVGDRVLVALTQALSASLREYDLCARWGGEEFLLLLVDTDRNEASTIVERLRSRLSKVTVRTGQQTISVTVSAGLSQHRPGDPHHLTVKRADQALLKAKRAGRDRILSDSL